MIHPVHRSPRLLSLAVLAAAAGCGSTSVTPPDASQGIRVTVSTSGWHIDPDGYTVAAGTTQQSALSNGTVVFDEVEPGPYTVILSGLASNCITRGASEVGITVAEGGTAEVAFQVDCAYDVSGAVLPTVSCSGMAPAVDHGIPGDPIALGTLPATLQPPLFARVSWPGGSEALLAFVDPETATMSAPFHPASSMDGGPVEVRISDEEGACASFAFTVDPLEPAPGEYARVLDVWQDLIEARAALLGYTVEELTATPPGDLPLPVVGLAAAQSLLDHPESPNSMRAILEGTAPDVQAIDMGFLDALMARSGLGATLEARLATTLEGGSLLDPPPGAPVRAPIVNALDCYLGGVDDAESLDACMTLGRDKILGDEATEMSRLVSDYLSVAGTIPGASAVVSAISGFLLVEGHYADMLASTLPTEFWSIAVELTPDRFYEDEAIRGTWEPALVQATSAGWDFGKLYTDLLLQGLKSSEAYKLWIRAQGEAAAAANGMTGDQLWEELVTLLFDRTLTAALRYYIGLGVQGLRVPSQTFGPIPLELEEHVTFRMTPGVFVTRYSHEEYEPRERGTDNVHIITAQGRFGGTNIQTDPPLPVTVGAIHLAWWEEVPGSGFGEGGTPPTAEGVTTVYVDSAGQTLDLLLSVAESAHPDSVRLHDISPGKGILELGIGTGGYGGAGFGTHRVRYTAPANLDSLPVIVTAEHTARTGARQYSEESRLGQLTIQPRLLRVEPQGACIPPEGLQFTAQAFGLENREVTWSASVGDISSTGYYTPPEGSAPGTAVTITATSVENEDVEASVTATIGCVCSFSVRVGGALYDGVPGDRIDYMSDPGRQDGIITVQLTSAASGDQILFSLGGAPTLPGSYAVDNVGGTLAYGGANGYGLFSPDVATFDLLEYLPHTSMRGGVSGTVRDAFEGAAGIPLDLSAVFTVVPDGATFLGYYCEVPG